jgi:hypothetical protein
MSSLGAEILAINAKGHPDIEANWLNKRMLVQVKTLLHRYAEHRYELSTADLRGIRPRSANEIGYLALLDCAPPAEWIFVEYDWLRHHLGRPIHTVTLRTDSDKQISSMCTAEFTRIVAEYNERLHDMPYGLLCRRAVAGPEGRR